MKKFSVLEDTQYLSEKAKRDLMEIEHLLNKCRLDLKEIEENLNTIERRQASFRISSNPSPFVSTHILH